MDQRLIRSHSNHIKDDLQIAQKVILSQAYEPLVVDIDMLGETELLI